MTLTIAEIDERLTKAGRLDHRIIGVWVQDAAPQDAVTVRAALPEGHPCVARALHAMSIDEGFPSVYVDGEGSAGCCGGALQWFGYRKFSADIDNMFSADSPDPDSMLIKASLALSRRTLERMGRLTPLGRYVVMRPLSAAPGGPEAVRSLLCFGNAAQMRDLAAMVHFGSPDVYGAVTAPWGSGCAAFVAYPSGMTADAPRDVAFLGPTNPEAEGWLPEGVFAMGIPMAVAVRMAEGYPASYAAHR